MSRDLPAHPNLDHLKKQAKERLPELRQQRRTARLADAQLALAREYGFASWPKLAAHVASLERRPAEEPRVAVAVASAAEGAGGGGGGAIAAPTSVPPPNFGFDRFTMKARQALFFSRYEASQMGSPVIAPEHVLLGLIHAGQGLRGPIVDPAALTLEDARAALAGGAAGSQPLGASVQIPFDDDTKQVLRRAVAEADDLHHHHIGLAHVLLGIAHDERSRAASLLTQRGMSAQAIRDDLPELLDEDPV